MERVLIAPSDASSSKLLPTTGQQWRLVAQGTDAASRVLGSDGSLSSYSQTSVRLLKPPWASVSSRVKCE